MNVYKVAQFLKIYCVLDKVEILDIFLLCLMVLLLIRSAHHDDVATKGSKVAPSFVLNFDIQIFNSRGYYSTTATHDYPLINFLEYYDNSGFLY